MSPTPKNLYQKINSNKDGRQSSIQKALDFKVKRIKNFSVLSSKLSPIGLDRSKEALHEPLYADCVLRLGDTQNSPLLSLKKSQSPKSP